MFYLFREIRIHIFAETSSAKCNNDFVCRRERYLFNIVTGICAYIQDQCVVPELFAWDLYSICALYIVLVA